MLLVKTKLGVSSVNGIGLFADEFILKGTVTWRITPGFDLCFSLQDIENFPEVIRETLLHYAYVSKKSGLYVLCCGNARFLNHSSKNPNIIDVEEENSQESIDVAARDIQPGEEMTCDYRVFDARSYDFIK